LLKQNAKTNNMATKFNLQNFLADNREMVIAKYNSLTTEENFNGCTLKSFMLQVMSLMEINRVKGQKTAEAKLPFLMGQVYVNNSRIQVGRDRDAVRAEKYQGTAYMAMV
jgi:hypothetical protein